MNGLYPATRFTPTYVFRGAKSVVVWSVWLLRILRQLQQRLRYTMTPVALNPASQSRHLRTRLAGSILVALISNEVRKDAASDREKGMPSALARRGPLHKPRSANTTTTTRVRTSPAIHSVQQYFYPHWDIRLPPRTIVRLFSILSINRATDGNRSTHPTHGTMNRPMYTCS